MELKSNEYQIECTLRGILRLFNRTTTNAALTAKLPKKHWKPCQISPMSFSAK